MSNDRETRDAPIGLKVFPSLKAALEAAAKNDSRSMASMAEKIISQWLRENGYLGQKSAGQTNPKDKKPAK